MSKRADFSEPTKRIIAGRAGYRCSIPTCGLLTIGPGAEPQEVASTGTASHIYAASSGGPRGDGSLVKEDLVKPQNGIWLCANHGRQVDTNRGKKYPSSLLQSYKSLHEAKMAREQGGTYTPFGWLQRMKIIESPIMALDQTINFGKVNLITGNNGTGKTALTKWIIGVSEPSVLHAWCPKRIQQKSLSYEISYFAPEEFVIRIDARPQGISYALNGRNSAVNPRFLQIVHLCDRPPARSHKPSAMEIIAAKFGIDDLIIKNVLSKLGDTVKCAVSRANLQPNGELVLDVEGTCPGLSYFQLSGGEEALVSMDIAIALSQSYAELYPTLLIVDHGFRIDDEWLQRYIDYLASPEHRFQTVVILPTRLGRVKWTGWEIIQLSGTSQSTKISQSMNNQR